MNKDYKKLELDKVLFMLSEEAWSDHAKEKIIGIEPINDITDIRTEIRKTDDAFVLSSRFGTPRFVRIKNICDSAKRADSGSALSLREMLDINIVLKETQSLVSWYSQCSGIENSLDVYFSSLVSNKSLENEIEMSIVSEEELSDNASPELSRIRKSINKQGSYIRDQLDKLIKSQSKQKYLQETLVTMRDGRYVVPVKTEYKNEISGLVHDTSSSGQTLFIEPMSVVEANNEIRMLKGKEQLEIERIIRELSAKIGEFAEQLIYNYETIIELEVYFAKSALGVKMKAITPQIVDRPYIELNKARHPIIDKDKVVPISIVLGADYSCLIVTGPNTGGKTVAIKTAGLLTLMAMCGLMIPASDGSVIGVFSKILVDIGDEQSIEQNLSTFSSHMNNIIEILKTADKNTLILLDELGSGTDPIEGAALAVSILTTLKDKGCLVIATTHYQEVKMFAIETDGVENACCEFDVNTLQPTYKIIIGIPGKSNAFAIAKRLGMGDDIIGEAENLVSSENKRFEEIVETLEKTRIELENLKSETEVENRKSKEYREKLEQQLLTSEKNKEKELAETRNRANGIINEVRFMADRLMEELEQLRREKDKNDFSERVKASRSNFNKTLDKMYDTANPVMERKKENYKPPRPFKIYDNVTLADIDKPGTLITTPDKSGNCIVQVGVMKTKTNTSNLRLIEENPENKVKINNKPPSTRGLQSNMTRKASMELDIRGMTSDEGIMELDRFIDASLMGGLQLITVIHGKGTGALRIAVHQFLKAHNHVKNFRLGVYGEGEAGVTVIELG